MSPPVQQPDHGTIAHELALLRLELKSNTDETREVKHLLTGNGTPANGLVMKTDRNERDIQNLKDSESSRNAKVWAAILLALGTLGTFIMNKLTGKA